jgi:hypothetical protein
MNAAINVVRIASLRILGYRTSCACSGSLRVNSERETWLAKSVRPPVWRFPQLEVEQA